MFDHAVWRKQIAERLTDFARDPRQEVQLAGVHGVLAYLTLRTIEPFVDAFHESPVDAIVALAAVTRGPGANLLARRLIRNHVLTAAELERDLQMNADLRETAERLLIELQTISLAFQHLNASRGDWLRLTLDRELAGYAGSFQQLRVVLRDADGRARVDGLRRLRACNGRYAADDLALIDAALVDNTAHVRASAARLLGIMAETPAPSLVSRLLQVALRDSDAETRFAAARALGLLRERVVTPDLLEQVESHLFHDDKFYRSAAALVLGQLGERAGKPTIVRSLSALLTDRDSYAREAAARALGRIGYPAAVPAVIDALTLAAQDGDIQVHEAATDALMLLRQAAEVPVLAAA